MFKSFKYAINGVKYCFKSESNFKIHTVFAGFAIFLGIALQIDKIEWMFIISAILVVLMSETFNTSIERVNDLILRTDNVYSKKSKDLAAAAVLFASIYSIIIGCIIYIPKIIGLL